MMRALRLLFVLPVLACAPGDEDTLDSGAVPAATAPVTASAEWPDSGAIDYRRERAYDLTADGTAEQVIASARGPAYDSLTVALTIRSSSGDTLWHESWPSLLYFKYDDRAVMADSTVTRIVRGHIDELLADEKFHAAGGLPPALSHSDSREVMREAVRYHLAELDWRNAADLTPADQTPPDAHRRIAAETVAMERVDAVIEELMGRPSFMYFAGGEATYALAWSGREHAFVRISACC